MTYTVVLEHAEIHRCENGDYLVLPGAKTLQFNCANNRVKALVLARAAILDYIEQKNLGGSTYNGGDVLDENGNAIAWISYNGRVWESRKSDKELIKVVKGNSEVVEMTFYKDGYEINVHAELVGKDLAGNTVVEYGLCDCRPEETLPYGNVQHVEKADTWEWDYATMTLTRMVNNYLRTGDFS